jgi:hypothetical protein
MGKTFQKVGVNKKFFLLSLIKNGLGMWEQARRQQDNRTQVQIKALPLFTKGEGQKRESGKTVWNNDGLNFYYTAEKNWKRVYNNKDALSDLCNKRERWEPDDKSRKNPVRTYWRGNEETKDDIEEEEQNERWEQEQNMGCREDDEEPDFYWDDNLKKGSGADDNTYKVNDGEKRLNK